MRRIFFGPRAALPAREPWKSASWVLLLLCAAGISWAQPLATPSLHWQATEKTLAVETDPLSREQLAALAGQTRTDADWTRFLAVFTESLEAPISARAPAQKLPPAVGVWSVAGPRLRFELRFPPAQGVRYRAELHLPGQLPVESHFQPAAHSMVPTTSVLQIFPSSDVLPENQLKFYVQFSAPMSRGDVYRNLRLLDEQGRAIELPFLELDEELWDPAMTRLTLLIDPGRIKRGVKPREDTGPVFEDGKNYRLILDAACRDAEGRTLRSAFTKTFHIGPADRTAPDPAQWKITAPLAGTREPLIVEFGEPMDQALALRLIAVAAEPSGSRRTDLAIAGNAELGPAERRWNFTPASPWPPGRYRLIVSPMIEDLAGNNIGKAFDVDLARGDSAQIAGKNVSVHFEIK